MLCGKLGDLVRSWLRPRYESLLGRYSAGAREILASPSKRGTFVSMHEVNSLQDLAKEQLGILGDTILDAYTRAVQGAGVELSDSSRTELKADASRWLVDALVEMRRPINETLNQLNILPKIDLMLLRGPVEDRLNGDIDMLIETEQNRRRQFKREEKRMQQIFNGPVGAVQNGDGAMASVVQQIGTAQYAELIAALRDLELAVRQSKALGQNEVLELVADAQVEAQKEKPNSLKLGSLLSGVCQGISGIADAAPAVENLRKVAGVLGMLVG